MSEPASEEGSESTSSEVLARGMLAYDEDGSDMMAVVVMGEEVACVAKSSNGCVIACKHVNGYIYITIIVPRLAGRSSAYDYRLRPSARHSA